jgi:asparagine N-glycosylation enzyme membrane subunit Stt3
MLTLLLIIALLGFLLGRRYKAAVLVPASFLAFAATLMSTDHGAGFAQRFAMLVTVAFALQASYLVGAATQNLEWKSGFQNARPPLGANHT